MIICWHDKNIIQLVKQQESFARCPATHYHEKDLRYLKTLGWEPGYPGAVRTVPGTRSCPFPERCWNLSKPL